MHKLQLDGDRNQCPTCAEYFNSINAFDKHRIGRYGINRRCMTVKEMLSNGMGKNEAGFWKIDPVLLSEHGEHKTAASKNMNLAHNHFDEALGA